AEAANGVVAAEAIKRVGRRGAEQDVVAVRAIQGRGDRDSGHRARGDDREQQGESTDRAHPGSSPGLRTHAARTLDTVGPACVPGVRSRSSWTDTAHRTEGLSDQQPTSA